MSLIAKYVCDYCGKTFSRSGRISANRIHHFCSKGCQSKYVKEHGPIRKEKKKKKVLTLCITCGKTIEAAGPNRRYCEDCYKLVKRFRANKNYDNLIDYCYYLLTIGESQPATKVIENLESVHRNIYTDEKKTLESMSKWKRLEKNKKTYI